MAGRFRFRLEVVRRLRMQARDAQRRATTEAIQAVRAVEERMADYTKLLDGAVNQSREIQVVGRLDVARLRGQQLHRGYLNRRIYEAREDKNTHEKTLAVEREKLAHATKQLKALDKLRERHWARYLTDQRRREQAENDEIGARTQQTKARSADREATA